jgi:DNA-binding LytR/AlgR family response regulator
MREAVLSIREHARAAQERGSFVQRHRATWAISAGAALLLAGVGAFETGEAAPWTLYSYWFAVTFAGGAIAAWMLDLFGAIEAPSERLLELAPQLVVTLCVAITPVVWVIAALAIHSSWSPLKMLHLLPQAGVVVPPFLTLQLAFERRQLRSAPVAVPAFFDARRDAVARFMERLPTNLRGSRLLALQAEDHYLLAHCEAGSAMILMRLSDAAEELAALDGARTHRSWWVARDAVASAERGGGRARLRLVNGLSVPVSRSYSGALRAARWY